jgi:hypothetical protein
MFLFHSHVQDILAKRQAASSPAQCIAAGAHFKSLFHSLSTPPNTAPYPSGSCSLASDAHWSGWTSRRARSPRASLPWTDALCATMMPRNKRTALRCVSKKKKKEIQIQWFFIDLCVCVRFERSRFHHRLGCRFDSASTPIGFFSGRASNAPHVFPLRHRRRFARRVGTSDSRAFKISFFVNFSPFTSLFVPLLLW